MRKYLQHIKNSDGFYLPLVLSVTAFVLIFLTTFIYMYKNDLVLSQLSLQQIEAETLIQMSRKEFMDEDKSAFPSIGEINYVYPTGDVTIQYEQEANDEWLMDCIIQIDGYKDSIEIQYTIREQ